MAHVFSARDARIASSDSLAQFPAPAQSSFEQDGLAGLRRLKNRLQGRFPFVRSSHLSEAIASGLGYNTNAAMRADLPDKAFVLAHKPLDAERLRLRLVELQYPLREDFSTEAAPDPQPSPDYLARLAELRRLQENPEHVGGRIRRLRAECATQFAQAFRLGHPEVTDDKRVAQLWYVGVDHGACLPDWGGLANSRMGAGIDFPGSDHRAHFFQDLPLARKGKHCEYQTAFVSMPYSDRSDLPSKLKQAALVAGRLGWTISVHSDWSWYQAGETELVLFRRTTPHEQVLGEWEHSFSRWALENRSRLVKSGGEVRRMVLEDIISGQHLPFDVRDFEDCRERYLQEFAVHLYQDSSDEMGVEFRRLMQKWQDSRNA